MGRSPCLSQSAQMGEADSEPQVRHRVVSIGFDSTAQPRNRLFVAAEDKLSDARHRHPYMRARIARTESERLSDVSLGFFGTTNKILGVADRCMSTC